MISFHLAGIIPVSSIPLEYDLPYHPCLLPLDDNYLMIHRSIMECAYAGCETIWIVADPDITPIFKKVIGDYVYDPINYYRPMDPDKLAKRTMIPIFFTTMDTKNRGKRDSYGWSIIEGAYMAYRVSNQLSKWIIPDMYYVSFPWGLYPPEILREYRKTLSTDKRFRITTAGEGVKHNKYLGFTFSQQDFINCRAYVRKKGTGMYVPGGKLNDAGIPREVLPVEERWSARKFNLSEVFKELGDASVTHDLPYYYDVTSFEGYKRWASSQIEISKPPVEKWITPSRYKKSLLEFE
tara:strand:- start:354 stop:1235 length:882 start_codon:yes stop_codon:yes gene_type:complete